MLVRSAALLAAAGFAPVALADNPPPDALVRSVTLEVMGIISRDKEMQGGNRKKVIDLVEAKVLPHFNFVGMTALAMGPNWSKATPDQKHAVTQEFRTLLVRTYASALAAYRDQKFDFRPLRAKPTDTDVTVNVRVLQSGAQPVSLDYDMEKTAAGWKVYNLYVGGISLVLNYRSEFGNVVRESGVDGLIKTLQSKNQSLERTVAAPGKK